MDQDDRQDGNTNTNAANTAPEQPNAVTRPPVVQPDATNNSLGTMTHTRPEVEIEELQADIEPAGINTVETTTVAPEIEPTTVAFTPENNSNKPVTQASGDTTEQTVKTEPDPIAAPTTKAASNRDKKKLIMVVAAVVVFLLIVGSLAWWMLLGSSKTSSKQNDSTLSTQIEQPKLGVALTVIDGTVEYSIDQTDWQAATQETAFEEGNFIRTGNESRTVVTLDDGSAVRLDANTEVKLASLSVDDVKIEQVAGSVYSRVAPSERTYTVAVDETTYEALGTAFVTIKNETESGVQVYQSSVKTNESDEKVTEGKQFFKTNSNPTLQGKLTDINIDTLVEDAFVNWNLAQDESDTNFKDKLGVLPQIKERSAALAAERLAAEQTAKEEAARIAREKQEAEAKAAELANKNKVTRGTMTLGMVGKKLSWNYTGKAIHGYKMVYSKKTTTPTFESDEAIYFGSINETSGEFPSKEKIGAGKYYVRVCAYTADTEETPCVDYSNVVVINI